MRNHKIITFKEFSESCVFLNYEETYCNWGEWVSHGNKHCCASYCKPWKKLKSVESLFPGPSITKRKTKK